MVYEYAGVELDVMRWPAKQILTGKSEMTPAKAMRSPTDDFGESASDAAETTGRQNRTRPLAPE